MEVWQHIEKALQPYHQSFQNSISNAQQVQSEVLMALLKSNKNTAFGKKHHFEQIDSYESFVKNVPIQSYEMLAPYIERQLDGEGNVLTEQPVIMFELTGGSSGGAKAIPYTEESLESYRKGVLPWLFDMLQHRPGIKKGRMYFSISPAAREQSCSKGGVPVGIENDAIYFGESLAMQFAQLFVAPPSLAYVTDMKDWQWLTIRCLVEAADLSFISIWSPTFMKPLLERMVDDKEALVRDVREGMLGVGVSDEVASDFAWLQPNPQRAELLEKAIQGGVVDTKLLWPQLDTISCWMDASAEQGAIELAQFFPHVYLQPKGLLSTEGITTLPWEEAPAPLLSIESAFYEFVDTDGNIFTCESFKEGESYRVLMTNASGLYRYDTGDQVIVEGFLETVPALRFIGRSGVFVDLCGEKLTEAFVLSMLSQVMNKDSYTAFLVPDVQGDQHYVLFIDQSDMQEGVAAALDQSLRANPQYAYARDLGQLGAVELQVVDHLMEAYASYAVEHHQRLGDIKPPCLLKNSDFIESREV